MFLVAKFNMLDRKTNDKIKMISIYNLYLHK